MKLEIGDFVTYEHPNWYPPNQLKEHRVYRIRNITPVGRIQLYDTEEHREIKHSFSPNNFTKCKGGHDPQPEIKIGDRFYFNDNIVTIIDFFNNKSTVGYQTHKGNKFTTSIPKFLERAKPLENTEDFLYYRIKEAQKNYKTVSLPNSFHQLLEDMLQYIKTQRDKHDTAGKL